MRYKVLLTPHTRAIYKQLPYSKQTTTINIVCSPVSQVNQLMGFDSKNAGD